MPHLDANGLRFHVQLISPPGESAKTGDVAPRPKVVMIHGLVADNLSSFYYTIANPMGLVADTYLYDLRGHGRSEVPLRGYTVMDHVTDLRALLDAWGIDEPVHLVGNSFGCVVALAFTQLFPERVATQVLIEAHFPTEGWGEHMAGSLAILAFGLDEREFRDWLENSGPRKLTRLARKSEHLIMKTSLMDDMGREQPVAHRTLQAIACPTLAIYGEGSDILDRAYDLRDHVPGCDLFIVAGGTHSILFEDTPIVRERTLSWIAQHAGLTAQVQG